MQGYKVIERCFISSVIYLQFISTLNNVFKRIINNISNGVLQLRMYLENYHNDSEVQRSF
jgi:hypothetical protein